MIPLKTIENVARKVMEVNGEHKPMFIFQMPSGEIQNILFAFGNDMEKMAMLNAFRHKVISEKIPEYYFITEVFIGMKENVRPSEDADSEEGIIINHYKADMTTSNVMLKFTRKDNKIVWGKREEMSSKQGYDSADRWNFYLEEGSFGEKFRSLINNKEAKK